VIDSSDKGEEWVVQVTKRNLVSLNPEIELVQNISQVSNSELIIHLVPLITEKIPVFIAVPKGEPPEGYQFLNVWPQKLSHTVSGPEEDVKRLQEVGLDWHFDLSSITKDELDALKSEDVVAKDEVSFVVPENWKKVEIPFLNDAVQHINGPEARHLRIDFLRKELLPIEEPVSVRLFYPMSTIDTLNPETLFLKEGGLLKKTNGVMIVERPLYVNEVSRSFLDLVRNRIEIVVVPMLKNGDLTFRWDIQFIDPHALEETYVSRLLSKEHPSEPHLGGANLLKQHILQQEQYLRLRFRDYMQKFRLFRMKGEFFSMSISSENGKVILQETKS
jgi:hypothetical protein